MPVPRSTLALSTLSLALFASTGLSNAAEGRALFESMFNKGTTVSYDSISESSSDSFSATGVKVTYKDTDRTATIRSLDVEGLKETADGRIKFKRIAVADLTGAGRKGAPVNIAGMVATDADIPFTAWRGGLTDEEKKQRIRFGNFTLSGFTSQDEGNKVNLEGATLQNADIPLDFRYDSKAKYSGEPAAPMTIDLISLSNLSGSTSQGISWGVGSLTSTNALLPTTLHSNFTDWMKLYSNLTIAGLSASLGPTKVFGVDAITSTIAPPVADGTLQQTSNLNGLYVNLAAIPEPQTQQVIGELGYSQISGSMSGISSYNPSTGLMKVSDVVLKLEEMADIALDYVVGGYTADVAQAITDAQVDIAGGMPSQQAYGSRIGQLSKITLESLSFSIKDRSLTGRLLDYQAKQMGTTGDQLAQGAPMMIGFGMGGLGMPELTEMVSTAVGTFLTKKGSIALKAQPAEPVSLVNAFIAGQQDPKVIPGMLGITVVAE